MKQRVVPSVEWIKDYKYSKMSAWDMSDESAPNVKWQQWKPRMMIPIDANMFHIYAHYNHFFLEEENVHWLFVVNKHRLQKNSVQHGALFQ